MRFFLDPTRNLESQGQLLPPSPPAVHQSHTILSLGIGSTMTTKWSPSPFHSLSGPQNNNLWGPCLLPTLGKTKQASLPEGLGVWPLCLTVARRDRLWKRLSISTKHSPAEIQGRLNTTAHSGLHPTCDRPLQYLRALCDHGARSRAR